MSDSISAPSVERYLEEHRNRLESILDRPLEEPEDSGLSSERRAYLREEAEELYWNELSWEQLTADERAEGDELVEVMFSGFLAFIEGLLLREVMPDSLAPASPRPEVVEDVLRFLATRCIELEGAAETEERWELSMTDRLIDLVLYRLHDLPVDRLDRLEPSAPGEDG